MIFSEIRGVTLVRFRGITSEKLAGTRTRAFESELGFFSSSVFLREIDGVNLVRFMVITSEREKPKPRG